MKSEEYLSEIRKSEGLCRAVLKRIVVEGNEVTFFLATDTKYSPEDLTYASSVSQKYLGEGLIAKVNVAKSVPDEEGIRKAIAEELRARFPAAAAFLSPDEIGVKCDKTGGRYTLSVGKTEEELFRSRGVIDKISAHLEKSFCGSWYGSLSVIDRAPQEIEEQAIPQAEIVIAPRYFSIANYLPIDGAKPQRAIYIADLKEETAGVTVCGKISFITEKETAKGKPYFSIAVNDASEQLHCNYFTKKATLEKVRGLKIGDSICITGDYETFNGSLSFRAKAIDFGTPPDGFVPEERPSRPVPAEYKKVFPEETADYRQAGLFEEEELPRELTDHTFVVFDLETTGLNNLPSQGAVDRIIEIGAVKLRNGKISEKFSSFIACPTPLTKNIVELTGITDDMLAGAPDVADVLADFFKFTDGCFLVGHNVTFDYRFIRYYAEQEGYLFQQQSFDTLTFAQEQLRLSNYKLNTVADYFEFTFNHHRAFDDAFVTAKIFIELVKMRGKVF